MVSDGLVKFVLRGARLTLMMRVFGLGLSFFSHRYFAGILGRDDYGTYSFALACTTVLVLASTLGLDTLLTRFLAIYRGGEEWGRMRGLLLWAARSSTRNSLIVFALGGALLAFASGGLSEELRRTFLYCLPLVFVLTWKNLGQGTLKGLLRVVHSETLDNVLRPTLMLGVAFGFARLGSGSASAHQLMQANLIAATTALLLCAFLVARAWPSVANESEPEYSKSEWFKVAAPLVFTSGIFLLLARTDILMLGILSSSSAVADYAVITRFSNLTVLGLASATAMIGPVAANLHRRGDLTALQKVVTKAVQWSSLLTALIAVGLLVLGRPLLAWFGDGYEHGYVPMLILLGGQAVNAFAGPVGYLLSMTGNQGRVVQVIGASAVLNVILNALLIPRFGVLGAATATALTNVIWNLVLLRSVRTTLKIDSTALGRI
ncbi:MAG: O-antigen/teichoic acid export membrane protein [Planctomycetota bacterium]